MCGADVRCDSVRVKEQVREAADSAALHLLGLEITAPSENSVRPPMCSRSEPRLQDAARFLNSASLFLSKAVTFPAVTASNIPPL